MQDTTDEMLQKQREIFLKKTESERSIFCAELIDFGRIVIESSIRQQNPDISPIDLRIAVFKRYYQSDFDKEEIENIINSMILYFKKYPERSNPEY